jgi:ectoine hydroxylase-related dioxygenase (phytanoyl-CoA dioxygenase family)
MDNYPDFIDSSDLLDDGAALRARLERDGYLFVRGLLPAETIRNVRSRLLAKAAQGGWLDPSTPIEAGIANRSVACKDPEERYMRVFRGLWADEELHRLRIHPRVLDLFTRIFGEPALPHPMFVQRNIFPQSGDFDFTTGVHQDRVHIGGATSYALWMPLGDCPREKGALAVAAGSHTQGILDTKVGSGAGGMDICVPIPGTWATGAFRAGDALIFQDVTVHKALPNRTNEIRMSFDARYQPVSQPVADTNMVPYSGCGTWEEVYAGWSSNDGQYYWKDLKLDVIPLDRSHYERRDAQAFEMAERGDKAARDAILRIIQRDKNAEKRAKAKRLLETLDAG